jgi:hypothetical protein
MSGNLMTQSGSTIWIPNSTTTVTSTPYIYPTVFTGSPAPSKCDLCGAQTTSPYVLSVNYVGFVYNNSNIVSTLNSPSTTLVKTLCQDCYTILKLSFEVGTGTPPNAPTSLMAYAFITRMGVELMDLLKQQGGPGGTAAAASIQAFLPLILQNMGIKTPPAAAPPAPPAPPPLPTPMGVCEACRAAAPVTPAHYFGHKPTWDLCQVCSPRPYMDIQHDCPKCEACGKAGHHATGACPP